MQVHPQSEKKLGLNLWGWGPMGISCKCTPPRGREYTASEGFYWVEKNAAFNLGYFYTSEG